MQEMVLAVTGPVAPEEESFTERMGTFTMPFHANLWIAIIGATIFTGLVMVVVEEFPPSGQDDFELSTKGMIISIYLAITALYGISAHSPKSMFGRMVIVLWGFVIIVLIAAYTANLEQV